MSAEQAFAPYFAVNTAAAGGDRHKAALLLYTMPAADRDWLLARLPADQQETLQQLQEELAQLGIPADRSLLDEVIGQGDACSDEPSLQALSGIDAALIADMLREEPVALIAQLLSLHRWPWRAAVLEAVGVLKRRQIENHLMLLQKKAVDVAVDGNPQPMGRLHQQLLESLQTRLETISPDWRTAGKRGPAAAAATSTSRRWTQRLRTALPWSARA